MSRCGRTCSRDRGSRRKRARAVTTTDPYLAYLARFFGFWLPVYDLFALPIAGVYRAAVRQVAPAPGRSVLDLCTGTGEVALRCAGAGAAVTGVDVTPGMLAVARRKDRRSLVRWRLADARALPFVTAAFDVVVLSLALHDMPWRVRRMVLGEARRVARDKVVVLDYEMPRRRPWRSIVIRLLGLYETSYFRDFVRRGMPALLRSSGLPEVEKHTVWPGLFALWEIPGAVRSGDGGVEAVRSPRVTAPRRSRRPPRRRRSSRAAPPPCGDRSSS